LKQRPPSASFSPIRGSIRRWAHPKESADPWTIDSIDAEILSLLQQNGRASTSEIAEKIGSISKVAVSYRIRRLIERKIIQGFHAKINPDLVGRGYPIITRVNCRYKGLRKIVYV
jgi:Lrp/AsnC family leucine-responsive transcriptional regulator